MTIYARWIAILLCVFAYNVSSLARADILATVNYFQYSKDEKITSEANAETRLQSYDLNLQFILGSRFVIGATQMTSTSSSSIRSHREAFAPNIGFLMGPLLVEGGPITKSTEKLNLDLTNEWREGKGYYAAISINDRIASWLLIGFQFTFLDIEYKKYFDGNAELIDKTRKVSVLNPSLRLSVLF